MEITSKCMSPEKKAVIKNMLKIDQSIREGKEVLDNFDDNYILFKDDIWRVIEIAINIYDAPIDKDYMKEFNDIIID